RVDLLGHLEALLRRVAEQRLQHQDDVFVGVVVVVEEHHVVRRLPLRALLQLGLGQRGEGDRCGHRSTVLLTSSARNGAFPRRERLLIAVFHYTVRPKATSVISSCGLRPAAWAWTAFTRRSVSCRGVAAPAPASAAWMPLSPNWALRTSWASGMPSVYRIRLSPGPSG